MVDVDPGELDNAWLASLAEETENEKETCSNAEEMLEEKRGDQEYNGNETREPEQRESRQDDNSRDRATPRRVARQRSNAVALVAREGREEREDRPRARQRSLFYRVEEAIRGIRSLRGKIGSMQAMMHDISAHALKLRSIYTWRDPRQTRTFLRLAWVIAVVISLVPSRWTFLAVVLFVWTKPFRSPLPPLPLLWLKDFWGRVPTGREGY
jgi:hypothetical protein